MTFSIKPRLKKLRLHKLLSMTALAALASGAAWANGTTAGSTITNTATVGYTVGGVQQPDVNSNAASFVVDMLVNLSVAEVGGSATVVVPGAASQVSTFTVTNTSNSVLDFALAVSQDANGVTTKFSGTDAGNATNVHVYVDNGDNVFNPADDTATYIDQLAAGATAKVFVVVDIPTGLANGAAIGVNLTATAASGTTASSLGANLVATTGADSPSTMDIVFGDAAGRVDSANDGKYSDGDEYRVSSATMQISKLARVLSDPFNGTSNPKPVPGAVIEYCIVMQNSGSVSATGLIVTDTVPAHTTFVSGSIKSQGSVTSGVCNSDGLVSVSIPAVAAGQTLTALFRTVID
jgi:uncharacterized repeat protein (TIGR01451 family)